MINTNKIYHQIKVFETIKSENKFKKVIYLYLYIKFLLNPVQSLRAPTLKKPQNFEVLYIYI